MAPRYPSIPEPTLEPTSLRDSILSIKQMLEILTGQRGNADYAAVMPGELNSTVNDLNDSKVSKSGDTMTGNLTIQNNAPIIELNETDTGNKWYMVVDGSTISWRYNTLGVQQLTFDSSTLVVSGNILANGGMLASNAPSNFSFNLRMTEATSGWSKYMRTINDGSLQWINNANTSVIMSLTDAGELDWTGAAWTSYIPTVNVAGGGVGAATGRYKKIGKTLHLQLVIAITTGGTSVTATLPPGMTSGPGANYFLVGRESLVTGHTWIGLTGTSQTVVQPVRYDNITAVSAGWSFRMSGTIELA